MTATKVRGRGGDQARGWVVVDVHLLTLMILHYFGFYGRSNETGHLPSGTLLMFTPLRGVGTSSFRGRAHIT